MLLQIAEIFRKDHYEITKKCKCYLDDIDNEFQLENDEE